MSLLWAASFTLAACAILAPVIALVLGAGRGRASIVVGTAAALLLLMTLVALRLRHSAAEGAFAAEWEQRAADLQRRAAEIERRGHERQAQYARTMSELEEMLDHLVRVDLPAALDGSAPPQAFSGSGAGESTEAAALRDRVAAAAAEGAARLRVQLDDLLIFIDRSIDIAAHFQLDPCQKSPRVDMLRV